MARKKINDFIEIGDARIAFKNFSGKGGQYNQPGKRNFCVILDEDLAAKLLADGWNVRRLKPKDDEEGYEPLPYLNVAVAFGDYPPDILMISSRGQTKILEENVEILDWAEIVTCDLVIRPYNWTLHKNTDREESGVKAYLKSLYVTIYEDSFAKKYANAPDSAQDAIGGCGNCEACDGSCEHI